MGSKYNKFESYKNDLEIYEEVTTKERELEENNKRLDELYSIVNSVIKQVEIGNKEKPFSRYKPNEVNVHTNYYCDFIQLRSASTNGFIDDNYNVDIIKSDEINPKVLIGAKRIRLIPDLNEIIFINPIDEIYLEKYFRNNNYRKMLMKIHNRLFYDIKIKTGLKGYRNTYINNIVYRISEKYNTFNILIEWAYARRIDELEYKPYLLKKSENIFSNYKNVIDFKKELKCIQLIDSNGELFEISNDALITFVIEYNIFCNKKHIYNFNIELLNDEYKKTIPIMYIKDTNWIDCFRLVTKQGDVLLFKIYQSIDYINKIKTDSRYIRINKSVEYVECQLAE